MEYLTPNTVPAMLGFVAAILISTVFHEMGHVMAARLVRIPVRRVSIGLGPVLWRGRVAEEREFVLRAFPVGVTVGVPLRQGPDGRDRRPVGHDLLMAAGGPMASLLLFVGLAAAAGLFCPSAEVLSLLQSIAVVSLVLGLLNLIPVPGLDGGHLLVLSAVALGLRLDAVREMKIYRLGIRLATVASVGFVVIRLVCAA